MLLSRYIKKNSFDYSTAFKEVSETFWKAKMQLAMIAIILVVWFATVCQANRSLMCIECKCEGKVIRCLVIPSKGALEGFIMSPIILDISGVQMPVFHSEYWFVSQYIITGFQTIIYPFAVRSEYISIYFNVYFRF